MSALPKFADHELLSVEEFLAFTQSRPDDERWELIEGVPTLNAAPVEFHQVIAMNVGTFLMIEKRRLDAPWLPMLGVGVRVPVSPKSLPQPDVSVKAGAATDRPETDDALVLFEVLSPSNTKADQAWRRRVYASIPNCQHSVTVAMKRAEVVVYDRANDWTGRAVRGLDANVELAALGITMPLVEVYRYTPIGGD